MKLSKGGWEILYKSAEGPDGTLHFPEKLTRKHLDMARRTMGSYIYANQYLNKIIPDDMQTFKKEWLRTFTDFPKDEQLYTFCAIDPAISQEEGADFTGIVVVAVDSHTNWYVQIAKRERMTPTQIINLCFELNDRYKPMAIGIEGVAYQKALLYMMSEEMRKRNKVVPVAEIKHQTKVSKEMRIRAMVPRYEWGLIYHKQGLHDLEMELLQFPRSSHDDICFVAGTLVATPNGPVAIEKLRVGDKIISAFGVDTVQEIGQREAETIKLRRFECTPNHPIFVFDKGFIEADCLSNKDIVLRCTSWSLIKLILLKLLSLTESNSILWERKDIISVTLQQMKAGKILKDCMLLFGKLIIKGMFQKAFTFIISIGIHSITALKILSVYRGKSILRSLKILISRKLQSISNLLGIFQGLGIKVLKAMNFISSLVINLGRIKSLLKLSVDNVDQQSQHGLEPKCFVTQSVSKETGELKNVYNIKTTSGMYFAGDILVSNCDALAMVENIVMYPEKKRHKNDRPNPSNAEAYESWYIKEKGRGRDIDREDDHY